MPAPSNSTGLRTNLGTDAGHRHRYVPPPGVGQWPWLTPQSPPPGAEPSQMTQPSSPVPPPAHLTPAKEQVARVQAKLAEQNADAARSAFHDRAMKGGGARMPAANDFVFVSHNIDWDEGGRGKSKVTFHPNMTVRDFAEQTRGAAGSSRVPLEEISLVFRARVIFVGSLAAEKNPGREAMCDENATVGSLGMSTGDIVTELSEADSSPKRGFLSHMPDPSSESPSVMLKYL